MTFKELFIVIVISIIISIQFIQMAVIEDYLDKMEDRITMNTIYINDMNN
jgi:hypothetical protein